MAEAGATQAASPDHPEPADTNRAAVRSVFAADEPGDRRRDVDRPMEPRASERSVSEPAQVAATRRRFDPRRLLEEHPVAAVAIGVGAIGLGIVGYRVIRHSLPVRLFLGLRFGRFRELVRP